MSNSYIPDVLDKKSFNRSEISLAINGREEVPTREEFYTNYPFFKYWNKESNDRLSSPEGLNIYIHIPFCKQICDFCFYMKELVKSSDQVNDYIDSLCQEIKLITDLHGLRRRKVNAIYIGGGTPSVLNERQFNQIMECLHTYHRIDNPEFTFEAEPGTFSKKKLGWYKNSGVNRISMGVQSFVDEVIELSNRMHTSEQAIRSIKMVQEAGGFVANIDLLSGLAGESMESWERSVDIALEQEVDILTIYKMKAYANTTFFNKGVRTKEIVLPNEEDEIAFMSRALEKVEAANYHKWSTFAFSKAPYRHHYAENTWRGQDLVAYGASSFGKIGNFNYQNINHIPAYKNKVARGEMPISRSYEMSMKDKVVKELLLCSARLYSYKKQEFIDKFGFDYFDLIPDTIQQLTDRGYLYDQKDELRLTKQGILFGDFVGKVLASSVKEVLGSDNIGFTY